MTRPNPPTTLDEWIATCDSNEFPQSDGDLYRNRLNTVKQHLDRKVYPEVESGALLRDGVLLTRHGKKHVETVVHRASRLLMHDPSPSSHCLTCYEVYLLLMAIYFHDVGNVYGREQHEKMIVPIINTMKPLLSDEAVERGTVIKIAEAHAGTVNGTPEDTIARLAPSDLVLGKRVRMQALAAVLRFADELADDSSRSAGILKTTRKLPRESEVYHYYAKALHSVDVRPSEYIVDLRYQFHCSDAKEKFGKGSESVYLLDEIYTRTLKMHSEREYCMRFTHGIVRIDAISVTIDVHLDEHALRPAIPPIQYRLAVRGYPDHHQDISTHIDEQDLIRGCDLVEAVRSQEVARGGK